MLKYIMLLLLIPSAQACELYLTKNGTNLQVSTKTQCTSFNTNGVINFIGNGINTVDQIVYPPNAQPDLYCDPLLTELNAEKPLSDVWKSVGYRKTSKDGTVYTVIVNPDGSFTRGVKTKERVDVGTLCDSDIEAIVKISSKNIQYRTFHLGGTIFRTTKCKRF